MPIVEGTAPSGEKFDFYVPRGTTRDQGAALARSAYYRRRQGIDVTLPPPPPESTIGGELMRGGESLFSALRTAGGAAFGDDEAAALAGLERSEDIAQRYGEGPSFQKVLDAEGIMPTVGTALGQIPQAVAGQVPQILTTVAAAKAGALAGFGLAGPIGSLIGAGVGGLASLIPQFTGYNIERQAQADIDEGRPVDIELGKAVGTAALQSVPELAGQYFILGKGLVNKLVQGDVTKLSATQLREAAEKLVREADLGTAKTIGRGIARGAGAELPTEVAQQVLERAQAGLDVLSPEALSEYGEAAYLAVTVGGTLGPIGALGSRSRARRLREELSGREDTVAEPVTTGTDLVPVPEPPLEGEVLPPTSPVSPALPQGTYRLPPPPTGDGSAILVDPQGRAYPERFAAAFEEAIANEEKLRSEGAQRELFTEIMAEEKTAITKEDLEGLGITSTKLKKELPALDLADPRDARTAVETIVNYANNPTVKSRYRDSRNKVLGLLNMPILTRAETLAAKESAEQEAGAIASEMDQIARKEAPGQMTIGEGIEQDIIQEQQEAAFTQREQERAEDLQALAATMEAGQDSSEPALGAALQEAQQEQDRTGRPVEGQAQLEIPQVDPADPAAQAQAESNRLDQAIAEQQRILEKLEEQRQEQVEMLGPRGGILRPNRRENVKNATNEEVQAAKEGATTVDSEAQANDDPRNATEESVAEQQVDKDLDEAKFREEFEEIETGDDMESFLSALAYNSIDGTAKQKADARAKIAWIQQNASESTRKNLEAMQNSMRSDLGMPLPMKKLVGAAAVLDPEVTQLLREGKLAEALELLGNNQDKDVRKVARAINKAIAESGTKVTFQPNLMDGKGRLLAGMFDPRTNTIILNESIPPTNHALLHESLHAVTSHVIANKSSSTTKQLQTLFDSVKDRLEDAYGTTNLDEFVAEAFSNPEFQAKLASMDTNGDKLGVLERFKNIVANVIRVLRRLPTKKLNSAMSEVDKIVGDMISPAPQYRNAPAMNLAVTAGKEDAFLDDLFDGYGGEVPQDAASIFNAYAPQAKNDARNFFFKLLPLNSIADFAKQSNNESIRELGRGLDELFKIIQQKNGSRQKYLLLTKDKARRFEKILKKLGPNQRKLFNFVVEESTLLRIDPSRENAKEYYTGYRYTVVDKDGNRNTYHFPTAEKRDAAFEKEQAKNDKLPREEQSKLGKINPSEEAEKDYNNIMQYWNRLDPKAREVYVELRDAYSDAYEDLRKALVARIDGVPTDSEEAVQAKQSYKDKILLELLNKELIEPYFPLFRKGDFWYTHNGLDPITGQPEVFKTAFDSRQDRQRYEQAILQDTRLREELLTSEAGIYVEARKRGREALLANNPNATPEQIQEAEFRAVLEGSMLSRPQVDASERSSVDIRWAQGLLADVRAKKEQAAKKARQKELAAAKEENRDPTPEELAAAEAKYKQVMSAGDALDSIVQDALIDAMPERSLHRAFRTRKDVRGAERDAIDVFRQRMPAFMGQVDNLKFDAPLDQVKTNLNNLRAQVTGSQGELDYAEQLVQKGTEYADFVKNPKISSYSRRLKSLGFLMTLGFNVSSAVVNSFILPIVVLPYLAGRYGMRDTMAAMMEAMKLYSGTGVKRRVAGLENLEGLEDANLDAELKKRGLTRDDLYEVDGPSLANLDLENLPEEYAELKPLIRELVDRGAANASTVGDMLDIDNPTGGKFDRVLTAVNGISGFMFHQGERFNRQITAMAAYKLALDKAKADSKLETVRKPPKEGATEEQIRKYEAYLEKVHALGSDFVNEVMLDVEHTNSGALIETAPQIAQGDISSILLMYKRFGVSMAYLQMKMAKQAIGMGNFSEQEQKDAKAQIAGLFGMSGLLAGAQGLPLYGVFAGVANLFFLDDQDDDFDSIVAANIGETAYSGILNQIFDADFAPRIGMTNLIFRSLPNNEIEDGLSYALEMAGGPLYGIAERISRSGGLMAEGEYRRGLEGMLPAGFSGPLKSIRYATEGARTLRGDPITEDLSARSIFGQFFGFAPADYTKQLEINARDKRIDRNISEKRTKLLRQRYMAFREGDFTGVLDADREIMEFNARNPEVRITGSTKSRSLRQHRITSMIARRLGGITVNRQRLNAVVRRRLQELGEDDFYVG
tara:strand:- start:142 stop:6552 length:6411 start_codon:yes stop_codon:yes gene_type:complete